MGAGYSGTPLARKLAVRSGDVLALVDAPEGWSVPGLDETVQVRRDLRRRPDTAVVFVRSRRDLEGRALRVARGLPRGAALWIAWPRKAGGHVSDVTEQSLRDVVLPTGLVDVKVAALDDDWSGLRFVHRREPAAVTPPTS